MAEQGISSLAIVAMIFTVFVMFMSLKMICISRFAFLSAIFLFVSVFAFQKDRLEYAFDGADYWIIEINETLKDHALRCQSVGETLHESG